MHEFENQFRALLKLEEDLLRHQRARLFSRIPPPSDLEEGHSYSVDLSRPWFESTLNGEPDAFGPAQLIGTYVPEVNEFLWGFNNSSVDAAGWNQLKPALDALPELHAVLQLRAFGCDEDFAEELSQWICLKTGWLGAYPAPVGDAFAFLALKLGYPGSETPERKSSFWCSLCGRVKEQVSHLLSGTHGYLCDVCLTLNREILSDRPDYENTPADPSEERTISCLLCGEKKYQRIYSRHSGVCVNCIHFAAKIVDGSSNE